MHDIEPYYGWESYYDPTEDERSPFHGHEANYNEYENNIYGYYIHPDWEFIGSETFYTKLLFVDYSTGYAVLEMIGEWNDTLHNDVMHLKRNVIDLMLAEGIKRFILIGEHVLNFHGGDDDYYQEWFDDVDDGWIAFVNFRDFVELEMSRYHLDFYVNYGGALAQMDNWRTMLPWNFCKSVEAAIVRRLGT